MIQSIQNSKFAGAISRQGGAALITGLIFIVVLTIIGITAARMASLEERMAGNMRDRALAMQAAELALRDAERDILTSARAISGVTGFTIDCGASTAINADDGLCYKAPTPVWSNVSMTAAPSVAYGTFTGAAAIPLVSLQPRYVIEGFLKNVGGSAYYYRITARAQGANPNTVVLLQEVFKQ